MKINKIQADFIKEIKTGKYDYAIHGCNCFCTMNSGVAKAVKGHFPEVYEADARTKKGEDKLGTYTGAYNRTYDTIILNLYSQYTYGYDKSAYASKEAIKKGFSALKDNISTKNIKNAKILMPWIGCGRGGLKPLDLIICILESDIYKVADITICHKEDKFLKKV